MDKGEARNLTHTLKAEILKIYSILHHSSLERPLHPNSKHSIKIHIYSHNALFRALTKCYILAKSRALILPFVHYLHHGRMPWLRSERHVPLSCQCIPTDF
jgi:hypothetical protein